VEDQSWLEQMENPFHVSHAQIVSRVQKLRNGVSCRTAAVSPSFHFRTYRLTKTLVSAWS
jgi:hypothetical protein